MFETSPDDPSEDHGCRWALESQNRPLPNSVYQPFGEVTVSVYAAVAQERPVSAGGVHGCEVNGNDQDLFLIRAGFGKDFARGAGNEALAPEFNSVPGEFFVPDAVGHGDVAAIGNGVT